MTPPRPIVVQTEPLHDSCLRWLAERAEVIRSAPDDPSLPAYLSLAEGLVVRTYTRVTETLLRSAPRLKVVGRAGVGIENIDVAACAARGITVVNTPDANRQAVVEYVFSIMLHALRPVTALETALPLAEWEALRDQGRAPRQLDEMILGVLGLGRIGRRVAEVARSLGMRTIYHDIIEVPPNLRFGAEPVTKETLFEESDILSIHVDGRAENRGQVSRSALTRAKADLIVINTARGHIIDAIALADFLRTHPDASAWLDVHDPEPFPADSPLLGLRNCRLLPHMAGKTETAGRRMSEVVYDLWAVLSGEPPKHPCSA